jgi:predicted glycoside hydrolase/deacetylase ChbG (UPF0249 family)
MLLINADDYGYGPSYDAGILEAARAGAIDGASAMVLRGALDPQPILDTGIAVGLHLELDRASLGEQVQLFEDAFGREPDYLDGHKHCHARGRPAIDVANLARERGWPVRSIDARHRRLLRCKGVKTADRMVGRMWESEPVLPEEIEAYLENGSTWEGLLEWVVHPGRAARDGVSSYDAGREEDLQVLLELARSEDLRVLRTNWR